MNCTYSASSPHLVSSFIFAVPWLLWVLSSLITHHCVHENVDSWSESSLLRERSQSKVHSLPTLSHVSAIGFICYTTLGQLSSGALISSIVTEYYLLPVYIAGMCETSGTTCTSLPDVRAHIGTDACDTRLKRESVLIWVLIRHHV